MIRRLPAAPDGNIIAYLVSIVPLDLIVTIDRQPQRQTR
jgi:hypothetical protein